MSKLNADGNCWLVAKCNATEQEVLDAGAKKAKNMKNSNVKSVD